MTNLSLTAPTSQPTSKAAKKPTPLGGLLVQILKEYQGQMPMIDLVNETIYRLRQSGLPAHSCNIYTRLRKMRAAGLVEVRRMDGARWACLPDQPSKGRRLYALKGRLSVRQGKAVFRAQAAGLPAYAGEAVVSYLA